MNRSSADWKEEMKMENRPIIKKRTGRDRL